MYEWFDRTHIHMVPRTHSGKDKHTCNEQIKSTTTITLEESTESNAHTATHVCLCTFEYTVARAFAICFVCRCCRQRYCISVCVRVCMCGMCTFSCGISINYQRKFKEAREKKQQTPMHTLTLTHAKNNLYDSPWNERDRARSRLIHNTHRTHLISQFREFTTRGSLTLPLCAFDFVFLSFFCFFVVIIFLFRLLKFYLNKTKSIAYGFLFDFDFLVSHRVQIKTISPFFSFNSHTKSRMCSNNFPVERKNKQTVEKKANK